MEKDQFKEIINKDFKQEVPSIDFTQLVMQKVNDAKEYGTEIEPLISKKSWYIIGVLYATLFLLPILFGMQESVLLIVDQVNFIGLDNVQVKESFHLIFSILFVFAALTLGDMLIKRPREILIDEI